MRDLLYLFVVSGAVISSSGLQVPPVQDDKAPAYKAPTTINVSPTGLLVTLLDLCNVRANLTRAQGDEAYELFQNINATNIDEVMDSIANITGNYFQHFRFCYSTTVMSHFERCGDKIRITDAQLEVMKTKFPESFPAMIRNLSKFIEDMNEVFGIEKGEKFVDCSIDPFLRREYV